MDQNQVYREISNRINAFGVPVKVRTYIFEGREIRTLSFQIGLTCAIVVDSQDNFISVSPLFTMEAEAYLSVLGGIKCV